MSTLSHAASDATTMLRRNLKHVVRYPSIPVFVAGTPIIFLLLFVYVLGGTLGSGLGGGRDDYLAYIVPGVLMLTLTGSATGTAISVSTDMTEGIVSRFRTMAISRGAVLTGHVLGSLIQTMAAMVLVAAVALLIGFRPAGSPGRLARSPGRADADRILGDVVVRGHGNQRQERGNSQQPAYDPVADAVPW
ncbi:ABC transporter permease [Arthrobacter oryzae]|uniref:ABC transporter permease n=1 Tax=Arthrobacter oryzae TaxID=409290 RepID=UPI00277D9045|nr:ABC transporter permease [Arthrobacter oryzae]MDQ0078389.1 hypothetical protein [Arthrobacter oryzae]